MLEQYFDFHEFWKDIRFINRYSLEDITLERATEFIKKPWLELNIDECTIEGTEVCLCFSEEEYVGDSMYETSGFSIWMRVDTSDDGVITWMRSDQW